MSLAGQSNALNLEIVADLLVLTQRDLFSCMLTMHFPSTENLQLCLGEFLPRLLDPSAEIIVLKEPPTIRPNSPYDLCSRFAAVMESIQGVSAVTVK